MNEKMTIQARSIRYCIILLFVTFIAADRWFSNINFIARAQDQKVDRSQGANRLIRKAVEPPGEGECEASEHADKLHLIGPEFNLGPGSLKGAPIPEPTNLEEFVKDKKVAIALGKALFWDMQVGSDGIQACASCHFRAGADPRSVNQLAPGGSGSDEFFDRDFEAKSKEARSAAPLRVVSPTTSYALVASQEPSTLRTFDLKPPNSRLTAEDFPFHKLTDPTDRNSTIISDVDDVVSSQGILRHEFVRAVPGEPSDRGRPLPDPIFNIHGVNTRRVEPRNTPTVINAIFNHRNFWDGRAQEIFNGRNISGVRDANATIVKALNPYKLLPVKVRIDNASLASLSVGPPLSADEMSFEKDNVPERGRFAEIGKRLLKARPLVNQKVSSTDSVLSRYAVSSQTRDDNSLGLVGYYENYIKAAFHETWWRSELIVQLDDQGRESFIELIDNKSREQYRHYRLIEYNFSLFFGLALQCYMATLVSDDAKIDQHFDRLAIGKPGLLNDIELRGLELFTSEKSRCSDCHHGPEFSGPNVRALKRGFLNPNHPDIKPPFNVWQPPEEVERMFIGSCDVAVYNQGFYNIGVRPFTEDLGIGGLDQFGNPLSTAEILTIKSQIQNKELRDLYVPRLSLFKFPSLASTPENIIPVPEIQEGERTAVLGAFKMPSLRNVALTAPYFHTGGYLTLRQVVEFYNRGGDFHDWVSPQGIQQDRFMDLGIGKLNLTEDEIVALVAFLNTLTDDRVLKRSAPFDHPQLFVPNGHRVKQENGQIRLYDIMIEIPAVGARGGAPIKGFLDF